MGPHPFVEAFAVELNPLPAKEPLVVQTYLAGSGGALVDDHDQSMAF
jgi:hypothetical protein